MAPLQAAKEAGAEGDEEMMQAVEEEAEFRRAQERLTMKHRNTSKWAKHALRRGAQLLDGTTKAAVNEQLRLGQELKQKVGAAPTGLPLTCAMKSSLETPACPDFLIGQEVHNVLVKN